MARAQGTGPCVPGRAYVRRDARRARHAPGPPDARLGGCASSGCWCAERAPGARGGHWLLRRRRRGLAPSLGRGHAARR
eukprot:471749-Alexandrium_andersonii.AAC.1